jgi:hypothetical protein
MSVLYWRGALGAGLLLTLCGGAHAEPGMGRLFSTPAERSALDANRGKASAAVANQAPAFGPPTDMPQPGMPGGMPQSSMPGGMPLPGMPGGMPQSSIPGGMPQPAMQGGMPPTAAQMMMPPGTGTDPGGATAAPPPPEQLQLNGVLRTSSGRSTVWLNNVPHSGAQNKFSNPNKKALAVTLPSGKKVLLRPGQRYDLADGRVKDINEP